MAIVAVGGGRAPDAGQVAGGTDHDVASRQRHEEGGQDRAAPPPGSGRGSRLSSRRAGRLGYLVDDLEIRDERKRRALDSLLGSLPVDALAVQHSRD